MNTIVAYPDNLSFSNGKYHHSSDNYKQRNTFSNLNEFDSLNQKDTFIILFHLQSLVAMFLRKMKIFQNKII